MVARENQTGSSDLLPKLNDSSGSKENPPPQLFEFCYQFQVWVLPSPSCFLILHHNHGAGNINPFFHEGISFAHSSQQSTFWISFEVPQPVLGEYLAMPWRSYLLIIRCRTAVEVRSHVELRDSHIVPLVQPRLSRRKMPRNHCQFHHDSEVTV